MLTAAFHESLGISTVRLRVFPDHCLRVCSALPGRSSRVPGLSCSRMENRAEWMWWINTISIISIWGQGSVILRHASNVPWRVLSGMMFLLLFGINCSLTHFYLSFSSPMLPGITSPQNVLIPKSLP